MAWIESHQQLLNHPKTLDLMNLMGWDIDTTIGKLHRLWWWCMDYAQDGDLRKHNASRLAVAVGLPVTRADEFVNALVQAGWLDAAPYLRLHDWWDYAGPFLQCKNKRHPEIWRRVRDLYRCSTGTSEQDDGYSAVPPNQPNLTNKNKTQHHHHHPPRGADGGVESKILDLEGSSPVPPDRSDPEAEPKRASPEHVCTPPLPASPENDLARMIYHRVGRKCLSRLDLKRLTELRKKHGEKFYSACDALHGGVTNVSAYLYAILEPRDRTADLVRELQERSRREGIKLYPSPEVENA